MKRLFFAAPLYHQKIELWLMPELKKIFYQSHINWVQPENIHITLYFFGDTEDEKISIIDKILSHVTENFSSEVILIEKLGYFGASYQPKVLWAGVSDNGWFLNAFRQTMDQLKTIGYVADRDEFVPHLTLGRIKRLHNVNHFHHSLQQLSAKVHFEVALRELVLYQSILKPQGPVYIPLKRYTLNHSI